MALVATNCGSNSSSTSTASLAVTLTTAISYNDKIVVACAADNNGSAGATSTTTPCTDSKGHVYTRRSFVNVDPGAAAAGITLSVWEVTCAIAMTTSDTVTVAFSPNTAAKVVGVWKVSSDAGGYVAFSNVLATPVNGAATSGTTTTASLTIADAVIGVSGHEWGEAITADADSTNGTWSAALAANIGTTAGGMGLSSQSKIVTATATQTYNTSWTNSSDYAITWISFRETAASAYQPDQIDINKQLVAR